MTMYFENIYLSNIYLHKSHFTYEDTLTWANYIIYAFLSDFVS